MKTTIDLADELAAMLKERTANQGISMRAAVHEALRLCLKSRAESASPREAISKDVGLMSGQGLSPEAASMSWEHLRTLSHDRTA